jgi:hypothetical protein
MRLGGPEENSGEEKTVLLPGFEPRTAQPVAMLSYVCMLSGININLKTACVKFQISVPKMAGILPQIVQRRPLAIYLPICYSVMTSFDSVESDILTASLNKPKIHK